MSQYSGLNDEVANTEMSSARGDESASDNDSERPTRRRIEELESENERLHEAVSDAHHRRYRLTTIGFAIVGAIALGGALAFPTERTVMIALGGTGLFGAVLTYTLTPERFVAATVGDSIYGTLAANESAIVDDLSLQGDQTIIPTATGAVPARLFIPLLSETIPSDTTDLDVPFVTGECSGLSLEPTGTGLYEALVDSAVDLPETPQGIAVTVGDALVEQFELIDAVDVDADTERVTMAIDGSTYGSVDRFDHPVASVLATTLAVELDRPVTLSVTDADRADWLVTCTFEQLDD